MSTLADLLNFVVSTLQSSPVCRTVQVLETMQFSDRQFTFKVRADLVSGAVLQVRLYRNAQHTDYAYQLFHDESHVLRWDNKEHFPSIPSYPHHFHSTLNKIESSPLNGELAHDLPIVLKYVESI